MTVQYTQTLHYIHFHRMADLIFKKMVTRWLG